jgi:hypothetical protein
MVGIVIIETLFLADSSYGYRDPGHGGLDLGAGQLLSTFPVQAILNRPSTSGSGAHVSRRKRAHLTAVMTHTYMYKLLLAREFPILPTDGLRC